MPTLQVRELPMPLYQKLKDEAKSKHRSLAQQAVITLAKGLDMPVNPKERRRVLFEKIKENRLPGNVNELPDPVDLIREDRDR